MKRFLFFSLLWCTTKLAASENFFISVDAQKILKSTFETAIENLDARKDLMEPEEVISVAQDLERYYEQVCSSEFCIDDATRAGYKKFIEMLVRNQLAAGTLFVAGDATFGGTLNIADIVSTSTLQSIQAIGSLELIGDPQQACIIFVDENLTEKARICSSPIANDKGIFVSVDGGISQNLRVTNEGNVAIPPATTTAGVTTGQLLLGSQTSANAVQLYTVDLTRNLFAGNYTTANTTITGTDNVGIGTNANTLVATANNTVAIGNTTRAFGTDSIAIGDGVNTVNTVRTRVIVIGSRDSTSTGAAPAVNPPNAIVLGSASGTLPGPTITVASSVASIAIGGSDGVNSGASSSSNRCISIGVDASTTAATTIALGSSDGGGGAGPSASSADAISIGSANGTLAASTSTGLASIALGSSDGVFSGAAVTNGGMQSIAIGTNATTNNDRNIIIGSASGTAGGTGANATNTNAIVIGSANDGNRAAQSLGSPAAIAIGPASTTRMGASINTSDSAVVLGTAASTIGGDDNSVVIGVAATASNTNTIAIGGASAANAGAAAASTSSIAIGAADTNFAGASAAGARAIAAGTGSSSSSTSSIAIGSSNGAFAGSISANSAAIALGGSDGVFDGAAVMQARSIAIGVNATTSNLRNILIGSASGIAGGVGPATGTGSTNVIIMGSASGANAAAQCANGVGSSIIIGPANATLPGASASTDNTIAIGVNARTLTSVNALALGSGNGSNAGAIAAGRSAVAIGPSDGVSNGASATGLRSVALGCGATAANTDFIVLGNATNSAVRIGIGVDAPAAKLHIVGDGASPVTILNQVNVSLTNAPMWLNPSTSAVAGTPIHYDASNRLFGFTSSRRYKENIRSIGVESEIVYALHPVIYDAKDGHGEGKDIPGFIAEEIYDVAPELAILNSNQQVENVAYNSLHALVIKEMQKQHATLSEQQEESNSQDKLLRQIADLYGCLCKKIDVLESK